MMKKRLFHTWILVLFILNIKAQNCVPDSILIDAFLEGMPGIFPRSDGTLGDSLLNSGCLGEEYTTTFTFAVPGQLDSPINYWLVFDVIEYWKIDSITGLPPGTAYVCEPDNCVFIDTIGCVSVVGQPDEVGTFFPRIHTSLALESGADTFEIQVNIPSLPDDIFDVYTGTYQIDICSGDTCNACVVGVNDVLENIVNIQQNIPNPFQQNTNIIIHSKKSDTFDFYVVNTLGEIIHNEQIYLFSGENNTPFDGSKFPAGVYFYSIGKNGNYTSKKMIISRM